MQFTVILIGATLVSMAQAARIPQMSKPKFNFLIAIEPQERHIKRLPEDRRKLSVFPRTYKKFLVDLEVQQQYVTPNPITRPSKKPLMKKFVLSKQANEIDDFVLESATKHSLKNAKLSKKYFDWVPKTYSQKTSETVKDNSEETFETTTAMSAIKADKVTNEVEQTTEIKFEENMTQKELQADEVKDSNDSLADDKEFIFVDPSKKVEEEDVQSEDSTETSTDYANTELIVPRKKRSDNIIVEENMATTVSGYKFTWHDTRLTNDPRFRNINS